jgi:hypothetical protein
MLSDHSLRQATQSPVYSGGNRAGFSPGFPCRPSENFFLEGLQPATVNPLVGAHTPPASEEDAAHGAGKRHGLR